MSDPHPESGRILLGLSAGAPGQPEPARPAARVVCIGGATVDRTYRLAAPPIPGTSNPASILTGFGGVARNVAANLARSGAAVELVSRVGDDEAGRAMMAALDRAGIGRQGVSVAPGEATADYAAVLTPDGELALGLAAMAVLDGLGPDALAPHADLIAAADWILADCNLPAAALLALLARRALPHARYRLAVDAVSVAKTARLPDALQGVDLLFANRDEAAALAMRHGVTRASPSEAAGVLLRAGAGAAVVTLGAEGALAASPAGTVHLRAVPARTVDVTGAGDALVAATIHALTGGAALPEAVAEGCRAAAGAIGHGGAVAARA